MLEIRKMTRKYGAAYGLVKFNREHFANYVKDGQPVSHQVRTVGVGLGVAAGLGLADPTVVFAGETPAVW